MAKKMGLECEDTPEGTRICRRYVQKKGDAFATGTQFELIPDQNCKVRIVGRINDEDKARVDQEIKEIESKCKRGF